MIDPNQPRSSTSVLLGCVPQTGFARWALFLFGTTIVLHLFQHFLLSLHFSAASEASRSRATSSDRHRRQDVPSPSNIISHQAAKHFGSPPTEKRAAVRDFDKNHRTAALAAQEQTNIAQIVRENVEEQDGLNTVNPPGSSHAGIDGGSNAGIGVWEPAQEGAVPLMVGSVGSTAHGFQEGCKGSQVLEGFRAETLPVGCWNWAQVTQGGRGNTTGTGSKRKVVKGLWGTEPVAVKQFRNKHMTPEKLGQMRLEAALHFHLRKAPNIVPLYGICQGKLVFKFMPTLLSKAVPLPVPRAYEVALDIARAVQQLHEAPGGPWVHRDVTALNFFLDVHGSAFLQDFGAVQYVGGACEASPTVCGAGGVRRSPEEMVKLLDGEECAVLGLSSQCLRVACTPKSNATTLLPGTTCTGQVTIPGEKRVTWDDLGISPAEWRNLSGIRREKLGLKLDVFQLGMVLWQVVTGGRMHQGAGGEVREWREVWREVLLGQWPPASASRRLAHQLAPEHRRGIRSAPAAAPAFVLDLPTRPEVPALREIMFACWAFDPALRPSAAAVARRIRLLLPNATAPSLSR